MSVASLLFLGFGLAVAAVYNISRNLSWRQWVLLIANTAFLCTFSTSLISWLPYITFLTLGYIGYLLIRNRVPGSLALFLSSILLAFIWLKKYSFLPDNSFLHFPYVTLGLSYVLFRILHLLLDVSAETITEFITPISFLNYTLNFTAIISGPIQRFQDYSVMQLSDDVQPLTIIDIGHALERIVIGYFKISVAGFVLQSLQQYYIGSVDVLGAAPLAQRVIAGAIIIAAYPLFLFCNFSGYTDMVIGVARWIRLTLPENFNRPFSATNFLDFWNRWHITLSSWLKTYVYTPLLLQLMRWYQNRELAPYLGVLSFFVTFFLVGVWHGRTSVFVAFGLLQGGGVSLNKLYQILMTRYLGRIEYKALSAMGWYRATCRGLTFTFFAFSLIWFWSNWVQMGHILHALKPTAVFIGLCAVFIIATLWLTAYEWAHNQLFSWEINGTQVFTSRYLRVAYCTVMVVVQSVVLNVMSMPTPQIVYKAF